MYKEIFHLAVVKFISQLYKSFITFDDLIDKKKDLVISSKLDNV